MGPPKGWCHSFAMHFFQSLSHDGSLLCMEHHPMEADSGKTQIATRLTTGKKAAIEGDKHFLCGDCEGNS